MTAFDEFVVARLPALLRCATAIVGDPELAKDIVQDVLVRAHRRWRRIEDMEQPERYLQRMILSDYLSWRRKVTRRARLAARFPARPPVTEDHAHAYAERSGLWPRLLALPARQRAVLVLGYYEDLPDIEIAEVLGCSPGSVRVYRARALAALRLELSTVGSGEERK
ncbi:SigE family RNA polymerase sigma factor [Rugosimonospora africana]|uniref:RNA polymerase n=1 Tax=Rugosimonospora africana TaxID=556532 RepID=A0A8J3QWS8_9ACTN|nr:SigE family RNA polymerase sigma factor [Rugosimonospora africana]GIH17210.1 RNA polymerase [Rugosimonospora africana]